jgi:hypothetical protein
MPLDLESELDRLYEAELGDFVRERKRIADALKKEGRKAEAARVLELRKPSVPAWAVNQLVRRRRKDVGELLAAGERLEQAQQELVASGDRTGFAKARKREQELLKRLREQAAWALGKRASDASLDRVVSTLGSAARTAAGREQLAAGRLTADIEPQGFEALAASLPAPGRTKATRAPKPEPENRSSERRQAALAEARADLNAAREREADAVEQARRADRELRNARKALAAAERKAEKLESARAAAAEAVAAARRALDEVKKT